MINRDIFSELCVFIKDIFQNEDDQDDIVLEKDTSFFEDLFADPEDLIELGFIVEEEFGIQLPLDLFDSIDTIGELSDYISNQAESV